jgi:hypothetical protein
MTMGQTATGRKSVARRPCRSPVFGKMIDVVAAGTGLVTGKRADLAARDAARQAMAASGLERADLALVFTTGDAYPHAHALLRAVRGVTGARAVLGASATALLLLLPWAAPAAAEPPGLALLHPWARVGLERQLGLAALDDLPVYEIDQALDDATGTLAGRLTLTYTNLTGAPLAAVPLLLPPNAALEAGVAAADTGTLAVTEVAAVAGPPVSFVTARPGLVEIRFAAPVEAGRRVTLAVRYTGRLRVLPAQTNDLFAQALSSVSALTGARAADYGLLAMGDGIVTVASGHPMLAPFHDGRFHTGSPPRFGDLVWNGVASFRVRTVVPPGLTIVTNLVDGPPVPVAGLGDVVMSEGAPVRDFVLVAGRDLARRSADVGPTRVTSVFRHKDAAAGVKVLDVARAALATFERRFGPYPYRELDVVQASLVGGAGGVEFSGMVLVAGMLYRSPADSASPMAALLPLMAGLGVRAGGAPAAPGAGVALPGSELLEGVLEFTVAHEVAHQYFAGLVGGDSHAAPALDEPLAQYAAGLVIEDRDGPERARIAMDRNVKLNYAVYRLLGGVDRPARRATASFRSPIEYAGLVYGKAPYLYVALRESLGAARLDQALRIAVERHRFRIVSLDEWIDTLEAAAGGPGSGVRGTFRRFLEEAHGDHDLGVDDSGDFILDTMFAPAVRASLRQALPALGLEPRALLRALLGGGLRDDAPVGPGLDPGQALRGLERLRP